MKYDFSGWATRNDLRCSDGRTIRRDAFKDNDGATVPLVWNHQHDGPANVLGHALLENRPEGVYTYGVFNDTESGKMGKSLVQHGDIVALSIYANKLKQNGGDVIHGDIREVSLVLAGANPGAFIESVISHSDDGTEDAVIYSGEDIILHSEDGSEEMADILEHNEGEKDMADNNDVTIGDVIDTMTDDQKEAMYAVVGMALDDAGVDLEDDDDDYDDDDDDDYDDYDYDDEGEDEYMKHNVFEGSEEAYVGDAISHAEMEEIFSDARRYGSMKDAVLAHGITTIETLFPEPKTLTNPPEFVSRPQDWVSVVMNGVHHSPFSRIKSIFADLREDDARAKGYLKGHLKKEEVFTLLKRTTPPTTIYKKQKVDRDDLVDITDFDAVAWLKGEMRMMLNEELARAFLIGDGRSTSSDDKIDPLCIRPIVSDADFYTIKKVVEYAPTATDDEKAKAVIRGAIKARKDYRGSGAPIFFTTEDVLTDMLLLEDKNGRVIYETTDKLANALRVSRIVTVPVMENYTDTERGALYGIIVNLDDYNVGADKGGAVNMFDDFDIDYNAQKYLIETRCSGALVKPYSAIALFAKEASA